MRRRRSFLYVFLGLASFVVWTQGGFAEQTGPLVLYAINLVLNLSWMPVTCRNSWILHPEFFPTVALSQFQALCGSCSFHCGIF